MKNENDKILSMLEEGTISAEEAQELLDAVEEPSPVEPIVESGEPPPDMDQFRAAWRIPFNIALIVMTIGGSLLWRTRRASGAPGLLSRLLLLPVTLVSGLVAVFVYISKDGPWVHVRVKEEGGSRFAISLPFPLHLVRGGLRLAQSQVPDDDTRERIEMATEFLEAVESADVKDPLSVDIRENGETVQVFIG